MSRHYLYLIYSLQIYDHPLHIIVYPCILLSTTCILLFIYSSAQALNSMMNAELAFHNELKTGLDTYLGPLRSIVSESAHKAIFINLEEVS